MRRIIIESNQSIYLNLKHNFIKAFKEVSLLSMSDSIDIFNLINSEKHIKVPILIKNENVLPELIRLLHISNVKYTIDNDRATKIIHILAKKSMVKYVDSLSNDELKILRSLVNDRIK